MTGVKIDQYMDMGPSGTEQIALTAAKLSTDKQVKMVAFQADSGNTSPLFIERDYGPDGNRTTVTATATQSWELQPGESSPWMPGGNINEWSAIAENANDRLRWITLV